MEINKIASGSLGLPETTPGVSAKEGAGFASFLENSMEEVNTLLQKSDVSARELAVGRTENLHETMIQFEKAETAFKLLMQVRNKALEAYNQVLSMQV